MDKRRLSWPNQWLIEQCHRVNFGHITLYLREGQPDLTRTWHTRRTMKVAGASTCNGPRPEIHCSNFTLCKEQVALLAQLVKIADGACVTIELRHGLPSLIQVDEAHQAA